MSSADCKILNKPMRTRNGELINKNQKEKVFRKKTKEFRKN